MKKLILCLFIVGFSNVVYSQWHRIRTMDRTDYYDYWYRDIISPSSEKVFYNAETKVNSSSISNAEIIYSLNGGESWDSLAFYDRSFNTLRYLNEDFIYFVTFQLVYLPSQSPYSRKFLHVSEDGGQTWIERLIDSSSNAMTSNALTFFNDSVAIIREQIGCCTHQFYQSNDQGVNWHAVDYPNYKIAAPFKNSGILMSGQSIGVLDFQQETYSDDYYSCLGEGSISSFDVNGNKLIRSVSGQDGPEQGYPHNNYLILSIHDTELSNQKVLHYPTIGTTAQINYNGSQIILVGGISLCSRDDGDSFFIQEVDDPEELYVTLVDFSNEAVGYALSRNLESNVYQVLKTTNGGGTTTNFLPPPIVKLVSIEENAVNDGIKIYPNPTNENITIESQNKILEVNVIQLDGKMIFESKNEGNNVIIRMNDLVVGTYITQVTTENGTFTKKIIKL